MALYAADSKFTRGETYRCALEVAAGEADGATVRVALKATRLGRPPGDAAAEAAVLTTEWTAQVDPDVETSGPGWIATLAAADSEALAAGVYAMDARITLGADVIQSDPVRVTVAERVTEAV